MVLDYATLQYLTVKEEVKHLFYDIMSPILPFRYRVKLQKQLFRNKKVVPF
jgi:hypothetical protein